MYESIIYIFDGKNFKNTGLDLFLINANNDITIATTEFELIQDEIDIDSIEKLSKIVYTEINLNTKTSKDIEFTDKETILVEKINELVQAVKQLNKKLEEK